MADKVRRTSKEKTVCYTVNHLIDDELYTKTWTLLTLNELVENAISIQRKIPVGDRYWSLSNNTPLEYAIPKGAYPTITIKDDNFLDKIY